MKLQEDDASCILGLRFNVVQYHSQSRCFLSEVSNNCDRATDTFADGEVLCKLGKTNPRTELLALISHDEGNVVFGAKSLYESSILIVVAVASKNAKSRRSSVKGFGAPGICFDLKKISSTVYDYQPISTVPLLSS